MAAIYPNKLAAIWLETASAANFTGSAARWAYRAVVWTWVWPSIPDSIDIPAIGGRPAVNKPIEEASLDDLAFAIRALSKQSSAIYRKTNALQQIYDLARNEGALGNMLAVPAAARAEEVA